MSNPNISHHGKSTRFKAGQSGNPKGRPKGTKNWSTIVKNVLADEGLFDLAYKNKPAWWAALDDKNFANAIAVAMCIKAASGDVKAATWLKKTGYGDNDPNSDDERPVLPLYVLDMSSDAPPLKHVPKAKKRDT